MLGQIVDVFNKDLAGIHPSGRSRSKKFVSDRRRSATSPGLKRVTITIRGKISVRGTRGRYSSSLSWLAAQYYGNRFPAGEIRGNGERGRIAGEPKRGNTFVVKENGRPCNELAFGELTV